MSDPFQQNPVLRMLLDCAECRAGVHCQSCACCMPLDDLESLAKEARRELDRSSAQVTQKANARRERLPNHGIDDGPREKGRKK